ncbi:uncharacterized protein LOC117784125 [Drosophila innubila]|uniref:uncharacterized protein LOC117784125 n=1 Tax=Drosophila innubila TaxID=198719 RepID=UPI00148C263E|nr:uncharacterized protein LOC117784125 [Drosophila innubila]
METCAVLTPQQKEAGDVARVQPAAPEPFTSHVAHLDTGVVQCTLRVLKMNGSTMLFLHGKETNRLDELAVAMPTRPPSKDVVATTFMGDHGQSDSLVMASKLSARYRRQFYVSMNLQLDNITRPVFEKTLVDYMKEHLNQFV